MGTSQLLDKVCVLREEEGGLRDKEGLVLVLRVLELVCDKWRLGFLGKKVCGYTTAGVDVNAEVTQPSIALVCWSSATLRGGFY